MKKIPIEVSAGREDFIEIIESSPINVNSNVMMKSFIVFTAVIILIINSSVIRWDKLNFSQIENNNIKESFLNKMDFYQPSDLGWLLQRSGPHSGDSAVF